MFTLLSLLLLLGQAVPGLTSAEIASALAAGERGEGTKPIIVGYGGSADPYIVGYAYPPAVRVALAANAAHREGRRVGTNDLAPEATAAVVFIAVESREKMSATTRSAPRAKPERILILPKWNSPLSEGTDADVAENGQRALPDLPVDFDGRVFAVPLDVWNERGYLVIFEEPALNTYGDSGREIRCRVIAPAR